MDGYTSNYYKKFATILLTPLKLVFNEVLTTGVLPPTWSQARVILIPKKDYDPLDPKSYRPISVLNQDYRIFTSVLTSGLNRFISHYINKDQTRFIPGREIGDNIRKTINILQQAHKSPSIPSCLLSLDISKAFDSVETNYFLSVLKHMGFGRFFINAISSIYSSPLSYLHINGSLSPPLYLHRGSRQGCPLSPLPFVIAIQPLAHAIRSHSSISGIKIGNISYSVSLFADDIVVYVTEPKVSLPAIQLLLLDFQQASGLTVNQSKSLLFPIHLPLETSHWIKSCFKFPWVSSSWHYLGIDVPRNLADLKQLTHKILSQQISTLLKTFSNRFLSLIE